MNIKFVLKSAFPLLGILFFMISCSSRKEEISNKILIDLDQKADPSISITDFIEEIRIIPLETTPENLVGFVKQLEFD